jgi:hypothetical protein
MQNSSLVKAGILALVLFLCAVGSWEFYLRHQGNTPDFDDSEQLWADKRAMVYEPKDKATVFIGSSRIKFDLDIPTWNRLTGDHAIQLSNVGSSPRPVLTDLANDQNFKGKLIIDITEGLFFADFSHNDGRTIKKIAYFKKRTPTERFSFLIDQFLESHLCLLNQDYFSANAMLEKTGLPDRKGVMPDVWFPPDFDKSNFDRQSAMTDHFVADTTLQNQVKNIWVFFGKMSPPPTTGMHLDSIMMSVNADIDKIRARGGVVLFTRTPSSGIAQAHEMVGFPRAAYWDPLIKTCHCPGIYYMDYSPTSGFTCPEWSHLKPDDAVVYTRNLVKILKEEKGWSFPNKTE